MNELETLAMGIGEKWHNGSNVPSSGESQQRKHELQ